MDLRVIRQFINKVKELDTLFQEMQTLKQQEVGLKLLTSILKRNETRLGGRFKMKTVIWYSMKDFENFFDICSNILFTSTNLVSHVEEDTIPPTNDDKKVKERMDECLSQFSLSDYDIVRNMEQIVRKLAHQLDAFETTVDYFEENSVIVSETDSNDHVMGIDMNTELQDYTNELSQHVVTNTEDGNEIVNTDGQKSYNKSKFFEFIAEDDTNKMALPDCVFKESSLGNDECQEDSNNSPNEKDVYSKITESFHCDNNVSYKDNASSTKCSNKKFIGNYEGIIVNSRHPSNELRAHGRLTMLSGPNESITDDISSTDGISPHDNIPSTNDMNSNRDNTSTVCEKHGHHEESLMTSEVIGKDGYVGVEVKDKETGSFGDIDKEAVDEASVLDEITDQNSLFKPLENPESGLTNTESIIPKTCKKQKLPKINGRCTRKSKRTPKSDLNFTEISTKSNQSAVGIETDLLSDHQFSNKKDMKAEKKVSNGFRTQMSVCDRNKSKTKIDQTNTGYRCELCDQIFSQQKFMFKHYQKHEEGKFCCLKCGVFHKNKSKLAAHRKECKLNCEVSGEDFDEARQYKSHLSSHQSYKCMLCEKILPTKGSLARHNNLSHGVKDGRDVPPMLLEQHNCEICGARFTEEHAYRLHKTKHTVEKPYKCEICSVSFSKQQCFLKHKASIKHNQRIGKEDGERKFLCQQCGKSFLRRDALRRHERHHNGDKRHMCQFCGYKCHETFNLKNHIALHFESQRNFICEMCGAAFHTKKTLEVHHQFKHSDKRNYPCSHCEKSFKGKSSLVRHMKVHSQEKKHECWCGAAFRNHYNLRRHMKTLHGGDSKLPPVKHVQTLDCPGKNSVCKKDFKYCQVENSVSKKDLKYFELENNSLFDNEVHFEHSEERIDGVPSASGPNVSMETDVDVTVPETADLSDIPSNSSLRNSGKQLANTYIIDKIQNPSARKEIFLNESVTLTEKDDDDRPDAYGSEGLPQNHISNSKTFEIDNLLAARNNHNGACRIEHNLTQISEDSAYYSGNISSNDNVEGKTNLPQFSLYGYPAPCTNVLPQLMYMQPRCEPTIPSPGPYAAYDQLIRFGSIFPTQAVQQLVGNNANSVTKVRETEVYGVTTPSLTLDQLRFLHHDIYSRLSQEEIAQRLNLEAYHQSLPQVEGTHQKPNSIQPAIVFDYNEKRDCSYVQPARNSCSYDQAAEGEFIIAGMSEKAAVDGSQEQIYGSCIDTNYLQKNGGAYERTGMDKMCSFDQISGEKGINASVKSKQNVEMLQDDGYGRSIDSQYLSKRDCSYDRPGLVDGTFNQVGEKVLSTMVNDQHDGVASHEDKYDSSIDADYLQSKREMAAESLALMAALTPDPVYNGHEANNQML